MPCNSNVFNGVGNDRRIGRRLNRLSNDISNSGSSVINSCYKTSHDKIAAYRLLGNERYSVDELISSLQESCAANACGMSHVLGIEDTTELDYHRNKGRLLRNDPDIGRGNNLLKYSFFLHPTLAVSATSGNIVGFSSVELFNRPASPRSPSTATSALWRRRRASAGSGQRRQPPALFRMMSARRCCATARATSSK